jgi:hypothetical protein
MHIPYFKKTESVYLLNIYYHYRALNDMVAGTASALPPYATSLCICQNFIGNVIEFSSAMECPSKVLGSYHIFGKTVLVQKLKAGWGGTGGNRYMYSMAISQADSLSLWEWDSTILLNFILLGQGGGKGVFIFLAHDS